MSADEVLPAFLRHRAITRGALVNVLISMTRVGQIERYADGVYGVPRSGRGRYESGTRLIFKLALAVPETSRAALCAATGYDRARVGAAINNLRTRGLFDLSRISVSAEARAKTERGETIFNKKGKVFWAPEASPTGPVEAPIFTTLRADRPRVDPNEYVADIARLAALPEEESAAELDAAARRWGRPREEIRGLVKGLHVQKAPAADRPLTTTERVVKKKAAEEELFSWLIEESHSRPECKQPELFAKAQRIWGARILTRAIWRRVVARPGLERLKKSGRPLG
jgi:hypothetical protein